MALAGGAAGAEKRGRKRKNKSRTQIEVSSSESESDAPQHSNKDFNKASGPGPKKQNSDVSMTDAHDPPTPSTSLSPAPAPEAVPARPKAPKGDSEAFSSIYLKKVTAELADDLVKVRDAQDFKASSLPMLVHALRQGESIYSAEEKRRVINAT